MGRLFEITKKTRGASKVALNRRGGGGGGLIYFSQTVAGSFVNTPSAHKQQHS